MKTKHILHVKALLCLLMISKINAQSLEQKVLNALSTLDQSQVPSGILYERSCEYIPLKSLDGYEVIDSINPSMFQLGLAYGMMEFANVDTLHRVNINPFFTLVNGADDHKDTIPIGLLAYSFDRFKPLAIDSNLIDNINQQFYDVVGRSELPYMADTTYLMALGSQVLHSKSFKFQLSAVLFKTNLGSAIDTLMIDLDDGNGWNIIELNQVIDVGYNEYDTYHIQLKIILTDGSIRYCSEILSVEPEPSGFLLPEGYNPIPDGSFHIGPEGLGVTAYYFIGNSCNDGKIRKPFILVEGFDPGGKYNWGFAMHPTQGILNRKYETQDILSKYLNQESYDIFFINYDNGSQDIFNNAHWVREAILEINKRKHESGSTESNIVVGASMGGLVSKIALRTMELDAVPHETEAFISFDSPLMGANIPLGMQMMVDHLGNHQVFFTPLKNIKDELGDGYDALNSKAASQMLYYHYSQSHIELKQWGMEINSTGGQLGSLHLAFMNQLNALGNLNIPHYGIANGSIVKESGKGIGMKFEPGDYLMDGNFCLTCSGIEVLATLLHKVKIKAVTNQSQVLIYEGTIYQILLGVTLAESRTFNVSGLLPYDSAPGGMRTFNSTKDGEEVEDAQDWIPKTFCFIPTVSSLAINLSDPYYQAVTLQDKEYILANDYTYLDDYEGSDKYEQRIYRTETFLDYNMDHVTLDKNLAKWLIKNTTTIRDLQAPLTTTYHIGEGKKVNTGNNLYRVRNIVDFDIEIKDAGSLWVGRKGKIGYLTSATNPDNYLQQGIGLHIKKKVCYLDTTVVAVLNGGSIKVGFAQEDFTGSINVWDSARLIIHNLGVVTIEDKSITNINKGGVITINDGGKFELNEESEIHIYNGGKLVLDNNGILTAGLKSKIYIHNGGIVHVLNGGILNLTEDSELIVEAHGRIIIEDGAIFKFEDGNLNDDGRCKITVKSLGIFDYKGPWKHEGNGYVQFDQLSELLVAKDNHFSARGYKKEIRFLRLNMHCKLGIECQSINLGRGRIDYESNTEIDCKTTRPAFLDSLILQATLNYNPTANNSIGLRNYAIGGEVTVNFCNFYGLRVGIGMLYLDPNRQFIVPSYGLLLDVKRSIFNNVFHPVIVDGCYEVKMDSVYMMNGNKSEIKHNRKTNLKRVHVSNMDIAGFQLDASEYFKVSNSTFTNCYYGLQAERESNIFAYQTSFVGNEEAIFAHGYDIYGLVELGCCAFYNNGYCIKGEDILFSISPLSGNNSGGFTVGNNKFVLNNQNQKYFDVDFWVRNISAVDAEHNYWGGSFPVPANYRLESNSNPIPLNYNPYHTVPVTCPQIGYPGNNSGCIMLPTGSSSTFTSIRESAMNLFHDGLIEQAEVEMNQISDSQDDNYFSSTGPCKFHYDYARVFTKVPITGGQPIITSSNDVNINRIYFQPNPVEDQLLIHTREPIKSIRIINSIGLEIFYTSEINSRLYKVNTSQWQIGIYNARIELTSGKTSVLNGIVKF
ncbi:MAG: hypothetical protein HOP11_05610 [Saprospiraceae bacterium]|nr:hypothetical protein [Saprospiraceae bacterium]